MMSQQVMMKCMLMIPHAMRMLQHAQEGGMLMKKSGMAIRKMSGAVKKGINTMNHFPKSTTSGNAKSTVSIGVAGICR